MRRSLVAVMCVSLACLAPNVTLSQDHVRVYVATGTDGIAGPGAGDSALDLLKALRHKERLTVVGSEAEADVVVRVQSRETAHGVGGFTTYTTKSKDGKSHTTAMPTQSTIRVVHATLEMGSYRLDLKGEHPFWSGAAGKVADQVDHWVKENHSRVVGAHTERGPDAERGSAPSSGAESRSSAPQPHDASIEPGMSPEQVEAATGAPLKKVTFGARTLWTYQGFVVVFEDDKVTDVKF
jgi:hypothetical protein